jgi:hypothetical protein
LPFAKRSGRVVASLSLLLLCVGTAVSFQEPDQKFTVTAPGGSIDATVDRNAPALPLVKRWTKMAADAIVAYYGRFPFAHTELVITSFSGSGVRHGRTWGRGEGGYIRIGVGDRTTEAEFHEDWELTHEFVHLTFPSLDESHHWAEEGGAVYVEPIARMRAGNVSAEEVWGEMVRDMPKGEPDDSSHGLDHSRDWASTYWGGALFYLKADVEIRRRTHNRKGLEHALRAIMNAGGNIVHDWEIGRAFEAGDKATGEHVLTELYNKAKDGPMTVDLPDLWKQLGVQGSYGHIMFDDNAPLANVRRGITTGK